MAKVIDLLPGDLVTNSIGSAIFIGRIEPHPIWPTLNLVIWQLKDSSYSFDALLPHQEIGDINYSSAEARILRLRNALLGGQGH